MAVFAILATVTYAAEIGTEETEDKSSLTQSVAENEKNTEDLDTAQQFFIGIGGGGWGRRGFGGYGKQLSIMNYEYQTNSNVLQ